MGVVVAGKQRYTLSAYAHLDLCTHNLLNTTHGVPSQMLCAYVHDVQVPNACHRSVFRHGQQALCSARDKQRPSCSLHEFAGIISVEANMVKKILTSKVVTCRLLLSGLNAQCLAAEFPYCSMPCC